jgi:hypothetical protein
MEAKVTMILQKDIRRINGLESISVLSMFKGEGRRADIRSNNL